MSLEEIRDPNLPSSEFIKKQTTRIGGQTLIVGLTSQQADALQKYAAQKGIKGAGPSEMKIAETPLGELEISGLRKGGLSVPNGSVTLYLGYKLDCYKPLFDSLGIKFGI